MSNNMMNKSGLDKAALIYSMLDDNKKMIILSMFNNSEKDKIIEASANISDIDQEKKDMIYNDFMQLIQQSTKQE
jgi:flagellar motor switch protein FliG